MRIRITLSCKSRVLCANCASPSCSAISLFSVISPSPSWVSMACVITSSPTILIKESTLSMLTRIEVLSVEAGLLEVLAAGEGLLFCFSVSFGSTIGCSATDASTDELIVSFSTCSGSSPNNPPQRVIVISASSSTHSKTS